MNIARHLGPDYPTAEALLAATSYNPHQVISHRAYLVHADLTPSTLPLEARTPGRAPHDISRFVTNVKTDANVANTTARSCEFGFQAFPGFGAINLIRDLLQLTYCYFDPSGRLIREVSLGYFSFVFPKEAYSGAALTWQVQGQDPTSRLARKGFLNTMTFPSGLPVTTGMSAMLQMDKLPPSRGGRKPSGVAWPGTPQSKLPVTQPSNPYALIGVHVSTVGTLVDGYWKTPSGPYGELRYNAVGDPLVDPVTFAPIDPWTHLPMPRSPIQDTLAGMFVAGYLNLWYTTDGGYFIYATAAVNVPLGGAGIAIDPFKLQPIPQGTAYKHLVSGVVQGTLDLPLSTWPHDYDNSGPYYEAATEPIATSSSAPVPIAELTVGIGVTVASRFATGLGALTMLSSSPVKVTAPVCAADPDNPGHQWCQAPAGDVGGTGWDTIEIDVSGLTTRADEWFMGVAFDGGPAAAGPMTAAMHCFLKHADGTTTDLASGSGSIDFANALGPRATFPVLLPAFTAGNTDRLAVQISLSGSLVTFPYGVAPGNEGGFDLDHLNIDLPPGSTQTHLAVPVVQPVPPTSSATFIPWPDTANPALTAAGCETIGPDLPADRIHIVPKDAVFPSPYPLSTKLGFVAGFNQLAQTIQYHNILFDTDGNAVCAPSIFSTDEAPAPVLHLSTEKNGSLNLHPTVDKALLDQTTLANVFSARSEPNQNRPPLKSVAWNDSPDSYISIENAGDTILRSAQVDTILDQGILDDYARVELDWAAIGQLGLTLTMWPIPWLELYDCILVTVVSPEGDVIVSTDPRNPFVVTQFSIDINSKQMQVACNRWVPE